MFSLLGLPDFSKPFVTGFGLADLAHLRVKVFETLAVGVRWNFDRPFFRNESYLIISVLVRCAVKDRTDSLANRHVVNAPVGVEQGALAVFRAAVCESDQQ